MKHTTTPESAACKTLAEMLKERSRSRTRGITKEKVMQSPRCVPSSRNRLAAGFPARLKRTEILVLAILSTAMLLPCAVQAQIGSTSGEIEVVTRTTVEAAGSLKQDQFESDDYIRVFLEKANLLLEDEMAVDITDDGTYDEPLTPGTIPAGETVTSVMFHADCITEPGSVYFDGTVEFSSRVLGVVILDDTLDDWDPIVKLEDVIYPTELTNRGLEIDLFMIEDQITVNGNQITLDLVASSVLDQIRVLVAGTNRRVTFSIDWQSASKGTVPPWGPSPIDEGCILTTSLPGPSGPNKPVFGPVDPPGVMQTPANLGITNFGLGGVREVDALSYGHDRGNRLSFSVDEFATGVPGGPAPNVYSEGAMPGSHRQAAADIFAYRGPLNATSMAFTPGNRAIIDGDGVWPSPCRGFGGLIEPNPPTPNDPNDEGDNVDAFDRGSFLQEVEGLVYFSLDGQNADYLEVSGGATSPNNGTAQANLHSAADVLVVVPGSGTLRVYATASQLGLLSDEEGRDDIDALAIWDDGDTTFTLANEFDPRSFNDQILYSLRRGSDSLGRACAWTGRPITESRGRCNDPHRIRSGHCHLR